MSHGPCKAPDIGKCVAPLLASLSVVQKCEATHPDLGGSKGGRRFPLSFTPKFCVESLQPLEFALTSVSLPPFAGPKALGGPLVLPASRSWLRLRRLGRHDSQARRQQEAWVFPRAVTRLRLSCCLFRIALVKRPFLGPNPGFSLRGVRPPSPNVVVFLCRRPHRPRVC